MQIDDFLQGRSGITFILVLLLLLLAASETGFRLGLRRARRTLPEERSEMATIQAAMLGLLGLLLGFTFAMAVARFDARRNLKILEINAIRTAAMRGQLLPEVHSDVIAPLFRAYVDTRLDAFEHENEARTVRQIEDRTHEIQSALWNEAVMVTRLDNQSTAAQLFAESLNTMIETREHRQAAFGNRVPTSVLLLLSLGAVVATFSVGIGYGYATSHGMLSRFALTMLIALVMFTIVDLDFPGRGFIRTTDESLRELRESLE